MSPIYDCHPIDTFPTVLEYNLFALCGGGDNLYPYQTGATSHSFIDEDGGTYTTNDSYLRSNINYGDRGYLVTPRIVVPADGVPISLMLHYRHGPLEVRATTADVTDTSLFSFPWQIFSLFNIFIEVEHKHGQVHECQEWRLMEVRI